MVPISADVVPADRGFTHNRPAIPQDFRSHSIMAIAISRSRATD